MKNIFAFVLLLFVCSLFGAKLDRSSQENLLKSWLVAVCCDDTASAWNALSENTRDAIKKEYSGSLSEIKLQWFKDVHNGLERFAKLNQIEDLQNDKAALEKVLAVYRRKITFIQEDGDWYMSSPEVEGQFYKAAAPQAVQQKQNAAVRREKTPSPSVASENKVEKKTAEKKQIFTSRKTKNTAPASSSAPVVQASSTLADNEKVTLAMKVVRAVVKQDQDALWQLVAPSNRADIIKKCGSEDDAKKDTLKLLALGIAMTGAPADIETNLASQMKAAKKYAENEKAFVEENGTPYIIAVSAPGFGKKK